MKESMLYKDPVEPAHWVGLRKSNDLLDYLRVSRDHQTSSLLLKIYILLLGRVVSFTEC